MKFMTECWKKKFKIQACKRIIDYLVAYLDC